MCIDGRRHVCCIECNVVSYECDEPTSCIVQPIGMCVVNKQFELLEFAFDSVDVDLQYDVISLISTARSVSWCVCRHVVVFGLSARLSWYPMWMR